MHPSYVPTFFASHQLPFTRRPIIITPFGYKTKMSKGNDNLQPLGICHRLISFIVNNLIGRGHRKVTLGGGGGGAVPPDESIEVPMGGSGSSRNIRIMPSKSNIGNGGWSNEVIIDFRHIEEPEISTSVQKLSSQVDFPKKNGFISRAGQNLMHQGKERQQQQQQRSDANGFGKVHQEEKRKDSEEHHREIYKQKVKKDIPAETAASGNESEEAKRKHPARTSRPLLMSVASNINEKADDFIRSRKEVMKKNYGFEQPRKL